MYIYLYLWLSGYARCTPIIKHANSKDNSNKYESVFTRINGQSWYVLSSAGNKIRYRLYTVQHCDHDRITSRQAVIFKSIVTSIMAAMGIGKPRVHRFYIVCGYIDKTLSQLRIVRACVGTHTTSSKKHAGVNANASSVIRHTHTLINEY